MPDPAFAISTICGSIASYFGVRFSKTTTSRRPRDAFPSIVQRSVFRNSRMVAVGSSPPGLLLPANRQAVLDSLSRRSRADNVVSTSSKDGGLVRYISRIAVKSRRSEGSRSSLGNRRNEPGRAVS